MQNTPEDTYKPYNKLGITQLTSFLIMYAVMFFNVTSVDHVYFSVTRAYMALLMTTPMAIMMVLSMGQMYQVKKLNMSILMISLVTFIFSLLGLRNQWFIGDQEYMKAMIPPHSSAILVSKNATIKDERVKKLSEEIIKAQEEEINLMRKLLSTPR